MEALDDVAAFAEILERLLPPVFEPPGGRRGALDQLQFLEYVESSDCAGSRSLVGIGDARDIAQANRHVRRRERGQSPLDRRQHLLENLPIELVGNVQLGTWSKFFRDPVPGRAPLVRPAS